MNQPQSRQFEAGSEEPPVNAVGAADASDPSYTVMWDWVWMSEAPDQAKIYYWALRAFIHEKDKRLVVEVSDDEVAELTHRSSKAVGRARKTAEEHGLVTVLEEKRRHGYTKGIKHSLPVLRRIRVQIQPPEGYQGWANPFEARDAIRARHNGSPNLSDRIDQATVDNPPSGATACWDGWTDLSNHGTDLSNHGTDLSKNTPGDQEEPAPQVSLQVSTQPTNQQADPAASHEEQSVVGWLGASREQKTNDTPDTAGARLLREWGVTRKAIHDWAAIVDDGFDKLGEKAARQALTDDLAGVTNPAGAIVGHRLPALRDRLSAPRATPPAQTQGAAWPNWCGHCDKEDRREIRNDGRPGKRCQRCHRYPDTPSPANNRAQERTDEQILDALTQVDA